MHDSLVAARVPPSDRARPSSAVHPLASLAGLALLSGCMTAKLDENRMLPTAIAADEGIVILEIGRAHV